ncbi:MAG: hypothetical protein WKF46_10820 [Candidatus Limnocylindrales bacterium]
MTELHEALAARVAAWREDGYPHDAFPAAGEILQYAIQGEEPDAPFPQSGELRFLRVPGPWAVEAMARRRTAEHPTFGTVWVAAIEDLILAKLMWSEGTSELQLRDCAILMRINRDEIDWIYTRRWAAVLSVAALLEQVQRAP